MNEKYRIAEAIFIANWVGRPLKQLLFRKRYLAAKERLRAIRLTEDAKPTTEEAPGTHRWALQNCEELLKIRTDELRRSAQSREWHKTRLEAIQAWQHTLPDPYRQEVCDILANGEVAPWHQRPETITEEHK